VVVGGLVVVVVSGCAASTDVAVVSAVPVSAEQRQTEATTPATSTARRPAESAPARALVPVAATTTQPAFLSMPADLCAIQAGRVAVVTIVDGALVPVCVTVQANQQLEVRNATGSAVAVDLAGVLAGHQLTPGASTVSPPLGQVLAGGVYPLRAGAAVGEVRLIA
jgi:hypothetical protein